jgi:hypothetical protein
LDSEASNEVRRLESDAVTDGSRGVAERWWSNEVRRLESDAVTDGSREQ